MRSVTTLITATVVAAGFASVIATAQSGSDAATGGDGSATTSPRSAPEKQGFASIKSDSSPTAAEGRDVASMTSRATNADASETSIVAKRALRDGRQAFVSRSKGTLCLSIWKDGRMTGGVGCAPEESARSPESPLALGDGDYVVSVLPDGVVDFTAEAATGARVEGTVNDNVGEVQLPAKAVRFLWKTDTGVERKIDFGPDR